MVPLPTGFPFAWPAPARVAATWRWARQVLAAIRRRRREDGLTVAVDVAPLFEPLTGVGWYLHELLRQLAGRPGLRLRLYGPSMFPRPEGPLPVVRLPAGPGVEWVRHEAPGDLLVRRPWLVPLLRVIEPWLVAADRNRVLFAPNFFPPRPLAAARRPLVVTVHDMSLRRTPWALQEETRLALEKQLERTLSRARGILVPSATVRAELLDYSAAAPETVHVTPEAGRLDAAPAGELPDGVPERFVLHVGTIEPRKNLAILLAAWPRLRALLPDAPPLVLCGKRGWRYASIGAALARATEEGWLIHAGYAPDAVVHGLYRRAAAVVCPSVYEGFGLPLVEAMAAGAPLVCSDIPVFREVAAEAAVFVPPDDAAAWAGALDRLLSDADLAGGLRALGAARSREFSWRRTADSTLAVWSAAAAK